MEAIEMKRSPRSGEECDPQETSPDYVPEVTTKIAKSLGSIMLLQSKSDEARHKGQRLRFQGLAKNRARDVALARLAKQTESVLSDAKPIRATGTCDDARLPLRLPESGAEQCHPIPADAAMTGQKTATGRTRTVNLRFTKPPHRVQNL